MFVLQTYNPTQMQQFTIRLPDDLSSEVRDVAAIGFEHNESEAIRECIRREIKNVRRSLMGTKKAQAPKFRK